MLLPETSLDGWNYRDLDRKYGTGVRGGARCSTPAWAPRRCASSSADRPRRAGQKLHGEVRTTSGQRRKKAIKRLRLIEAFRRSGNRPSG
jgi:hypothetical protein